MYTDSTVVSFSIMGFAFGLQTVFLYFKVTMNSTGNHASHNNWLEPMITTYSTQHSWLRKYTIVLKKQAVLLVYS